MQDTNDAPNREEQDQSNTPEVSEATVRADTSNTPIEETAHAVVDSTTGVESQSKKPNKKLVVIIMALLTVVLVSAVAVFAYVSLQSSPEERLQQAIKNAASITSVTQTTQVEAKVEGGSDLKGTVIAQRDVTDPSNPKVKATVDLDVALLGITIELKSEYICVSQTECYVKYDEFKVPKELSTTDNSAFLGKWLKFDPTNTDQKADPFAILGSINTVLGEIITGNISGAASDAITSRASDGTTYTFTSASNEKLGKIATTKYALELDAMAIMNMNKIVAEQYAIKNIFSNVSDVTDTAILWVNSADNTIAQVEIASNNTKSVITYDKYNEKLTITAPDTFLNPDQYVNIFQ